MTTLQIEVEDARPVAAQCDDHHLTVTLADGRVLLAPLWWYPRLLAATADRDRKSNYRRSESIGPKSTRTSASRACSAAPRRLRAKEPATQSS